MRSEIELGFKQHLFHDNKHYWHLSRKKLERMDMLFDMIKKGRTAEVTRGTEAELYVNTKERREKQNA